ncbi:MAG: NADH-quinone oxidoreductase subunit A [Candidatus Hecatellaceae archaeon]
MGFEILISPPFIFFVTVIVAIIIFLIGGVTAAKGEKTPGKLAPYACGEDFPPERLRIDVRRLFIYGLYFLIFDAFALIFALSFARPGVFPVVFALLALIAVIVMLPVKWYE